MRSRKRLEILRSGGLVAFPTDTVYGLGALVSEPRSIENLYEVKGRDAAKAIPVLIGDPSVLPQVAAEVSPIVQRLAACFWPGPLTWSSPAAGTCLKSCLLCPRWACGCPTIPRR